MTEPPNRADRERVVGWFGCGSGGGPLLKKWANGTLQPDDDALALTTWDRLAEAFRDHRLAERERVIEVARQSIGKKIGPAGVGIWSMLKAAMLGEGG